MAKHSLLSRCPSY